MKLFAEIQLALLKFKHWSVSHSKILSRIAVSVSAVYVVIVMILTLGAYIAPDTSFKTILETGTTCAGLIIISAIVICALVLKCSDYITHRN